MLLDAGALLTPKIWQEAVASRARGVLRLLEGRGLLPRNLETAIALGNRAGVEECLERVPEAFLLACRFGHRDLAEWLFDECVASDPELGTRVKDGPGREALLEELIGNPHRFGAPWHRPVGVWATWVLVGLRKAIDAGQFAVFSQRLEETPELLGRRYLAEQVQLVEQTVLQNRGEMLARFWELSPALLRVRRPPRSSVMVFAMEYGRSHLLPLLRRVWPVRDDLCHAAGAGDLVRVREWFEDGQLRGTLRQHYPTCSAETLRARRWKPARRQQILDVALAWACVNRHFEIAEFLLERGANIQTDWSTHEPASILHECAIHGYYEVAQFLLDHGIDRTILDYRWRATAEGWARYGAGDERMAKLLARAGAV
jgi:hypothetical protein